MTTPSSGTSCLLLHIGQVRLLSFRTFSRHPRHRVWLHGRSFGFSNSSKQIGHSVMSAIDDFCCRINKKTHLQPIIKFSANLECELCHQRQCSEGIHLFELHLGPLVPLHPSHPCTPHTLVQLHSSHPCALAPSHQCAFAPLALLCPRIPLHTIVSLHSSYPCTLCAHVLSCKGCEGWKG